MDNLGLFPAPFFFGFMPRKPLRLEYRDWQASRGWGPWTEMSQTPPRRLWHAIIHPWITEARALEILVRNLTKAVVKQLPDPDVNTLRDNFYFRAICHLARRRAPGAEQVSLRLWQGDSLLLETGATLEAAERE